MNLESNYPLVHITHEDVFGVLIKFGAYASTVRYEMMGIEFETTLLNEEFTIVQELDLGI